jgi:hypothetical protein
MLWLLSTAFELVIPDTHISIQSARSDSTHHRLSEILPIWIYTLMIEAKSAVLLSCGYHTMITMRTSALRTMVAYLS